ncbi:MAG: hypothetical protein WC390_07360 [Sulfurimonas sp.]
MRRFFRDGFKIILPVLQQYMDLQTYFPYINFIEKDKLNINYEEQKLISDNGRIIIPMRWSREYFKGCLYDTMRNKYRMVGMELDEWRKLTWLRHRYKEDKLKELLNIKNGDKYNLINCNFHTFDNCFKNISVKNEYRNINMNFIDGYNLLDWAGIIEEATEIHTVNTSLFFLIETLKLQAKELHLYSRNSEGRDFLQTEYLHSKNYIRHI